MILRTNDLVLQRTVIICGVVAATAGLAGLLFVSRSILYPVFGAILFAVVLNRFAAMPGKCLPTSLSRKTRVGLAIVGILFSIGLTIIGVPQSSEKAKIGPNLSSELSI